MTQRIRPISRPRRGAELTIDVVLTYLVELITLTIPLLTDKEVVNPDPSSDSTTSDTTTT